MHFKCKFHKFYQKFLNKLLKEAAVDENTTIVALTGAGNFFSSGNDLSNFTNISGTIAEEAQKGQKVLQ